MTDKKIPKPEDIQKEFEDFIQNRFGKSVQIIAQDFSSAFAKNKEAKKEDSNKQQSAEDNKQEISFDLKPQDIKIYLDRFVIGQDEAKKALSIAVCDHYNQIISQQNSADKTTAEFYAKQNVLILGPTGVGKTFLIKQIAKLIGVPFVKADATRFSETGYMGANVDDLIKDLVNQADGNIEKAQYGIVYLDEADKLAAAYGHQGRDVSGRGVQLGLLKLMEETEVDLKSGQDPASQMQAFLDMQQKGRVEKQIINTKNILFIVSGAFTGLDEIIEKRLNKNSIGFKQKQDRNAPTPTLLNEAATADFIKYGFEPEFVGRLPIRVACNPLTEEMLYEILRNSEGSIINQYIQSFQTYGIEAQFTDEALKSIAKLAAAEDTGARSLMTTIEKILRDFKYHLPSTDIVEFKIDANLVQNPQKSLEGYLNSSEQNFTKEMKEIKEFERDFTLTYGMKIKFDSLACKKILENTKKNEASIKEFCWNILQSYEHGLKLIQQNTGKTEFILGLAVVENSKHELERMVKDSYNKPKEV